MRARLVRELRRWERLVRVAAILVAVLHPRGGVASEAPPAGHTREIAVTRAAVAPRIDGFLESVWADAHVATDFWVSDYRRPPVERTEVFVLADDNALYFAFMCYDSRPDAIRADAIGRDRSMELDDRVVVELDPYHNHRLVSTFTVNARGTQADAHAGGRAQKIGWKGDWQAATRRTDFGWIVEIAIPFGTLEFEPTSTVFGVNFVRFHSRTQEWSHWADVTPQNRPEEAGHITSLELSGVGNVTRLAAMPYTSGGMNVENRSGEVRDVTATAGVDVRLDLARSVTSVVTVNPDFSQVESTIVDLSFDYNEKFRRDPRPFFQEGAGFFGSRTYFYSSRIPNFLVGAKTFGRVGGYQFGALALDDPGNDRRDYAASVKRELGETATAGVTFVGTDRQDFSSGLFSAQTSGRIGRMTFAVDAAGTSTARRAGNGNLAVVSLGYSGPYLQLSTTVDRIDPGFFPANGFIAEDTLGTQAASSKVQLGRGFGSGWLRRIDVKASFTERQTLDRVLQREELSVSGGLETRSNLALSVGATAGPYRPRAGDDDKGWANFMYDDRLYFASVSQYKSSGRLSYGLTYSWGFLADAPYEDIAPYLSVKPSARTSITYSYERADSFGISEQHVLSWSWDITSQNAFSGRWVQSESSEFRVAYRRAVRRGLDVFAVFNHDPADKNQFTAKVVWTVNLLSRARH